MEYEIFLLITCIYSEICAKWPRESEPNKKIKGNNKRQRQICMWNVDQETKKKKKRCEENEMKQIVHFQSLSKNATETCANRAQVQRSMRTKERACSLATCCIYTIFFNEYERLLITWDSLISCAVKSGQCQSQHTHTTNATCTTRRAQNKVSV